MAVEVVVVARAAAEDSAEIMESKVDEEWCCWCAGGGESIPSGRPVEEAAAAVAVDGVVAFVTAVDFPDEAVVVVAVVVAVDPGAVEALLDFRVALEALASFSASSSRSIRSRSKSFSDSRYKLDRLAEATNAAVRCERRQTNKCELVG